MKIYNFVCFGVTLENLFLGTFDLNLPILRCDVMQVVFINECNVFIFRNKRQTDYDINIAK